jgi:hypothetical protein
VTFAGTPPRAARRTYCRAMSRTGVTSRRLARLAAVLLAAAALPPVAAHADVAMTRTPRLTSGVPFGRVRYGDASSIFGYLTGPRGPISRGAIELWWRPHGTQAWRRRATGRTKPTGFYRFAFTMVEPSDFVVRYPHTAARGATSPVRTVLVRPGLGWNWAAGRAMVVAVKPGGAGRAVLQQQGALGGWRSVYGTPVDADGVVLLHAPGPGTYRAMVVRTGWLPAFGDVTVLDR